jgi:hypothetical protein
MPRVTGTDRRQVVGGRLDEGAYAPRVAAADALEQLYAVDLDEFVAERKRLERELRGAGKSAEADEIAARRKPPLPVFLANRLARARPRDVEALIDAAGRLAKAQREGDAGGVRTAGAALNGAVRELVDAAGVLSRGLSSDVSQRLATTLRAAASSEQRADALRRGVLADEVEPSGFEAFAGVTLEPRKTTRKAPKPAAAAKRESKAEAARTQRLAELETDLEAARKTLAGAEAALGAAEREAARARKRVADLNARLGKAR